MGQRGWVDEDIRFYYVGAWRKLLAFQAAKAAAPFCHPQLQAVAHWFRDRHSATGRFRISSAILRDRRGAEFDRYPSDRP
jgi:hypothetical protein